MKSILVVVATFLLSIPLLFSTPRDRATVLYLIPFHLQDTTTIVVEEMANDSDIFALSPFEMMGFWEGTQMALEEFESENFFLKIIVKDLVTSEKKLDSIFNNEELMKEVDLVVGPFYGVMFSKAAAYCDSLKIPIINPFSTKRQIAEQHPSVYKITPPLAAIPAKVMEKIVSQHPNYAVTLWSDSTEVFPLKNAYKEHFTLNGIPFSESINVTIDSTIHNIVIALFDPHKSVSEHLPHLATFAKSDSVTFIFPEEWLELPNIDRDFYAIPNLYFLSKYFVDKDDEITQIFDYNYIQRFNSPPQITRFVYQGYDITHYFITQILKEKKIEERPLPTMLCYDFDFQPIEKGGFENKRVRLIKITNCKLIEIK